MTRSRPRRASSPASSRPTCPLPAPRSRRTGRGDGTERRSGTRWRLTIAPPAERAVDPLDVGEALLGRVRRHVPVEDLVGGDARRDEEAHGLSLPRARPVLTTSAVFFEPNAIPFTSAIVDVRGAGLPRHVVEVALGVRVVEVDRRREEAGVQREEGRREARPPPRRPAGDRPGSSTLLPGIRSSPRLRARSSWRASRSGRSAPSRCRGTGRSRRPRGRGPRPRALRSSRAPAPRPTRRAATRW